LSDAKLTDKFRALAEETARSFGLELFDIEHRIGGRRWWFRVTLDRLDGEVTLADCEAVSRHLSVRLDVEDLVPHAYEIEVSSPGVERPLRSEKDFVRFARHRAKLVLGPGGPDAGMAYEGEIQGCEGGEVALRPDGGEVVRVALPRLKSAHLVFRFDAR
jgi:ribosome maturation factor RimP